MAYCLRFWKWKKINDIIEDKFIPNTIFECFICQKKISFNIMNKEDYVSATEQKSFGMILTTYRVFHDSETERHYNAILVDEDGVYRGHVDSYREALPQIIESGRKTIQTNKQIEKKTKLYYGKVSSDIIYKREKSAFILDKAILNIISKSGPISLEELHLKTLNLENLIGTKISSELIETTCKKYVLQGLIQELEE